MKKTLFFLIFGGNFVFSQNPDLFNIDWHISKIILNDQTFNAPSMQGSIGQSLFYNNGNINYSFVSSYYNSAGSNITFNTSTDSFTRLGSSVTLLVYNGTNATAVQDFDLKNWDFFLNKPVGNIYNYEIINNGNSKILIITDATTGDKIYYNSAILYTKELNNKKSLRISNNPVKDILIIEGIKKKSIVKIFDLSGKLILEHRSKEDQLKLNVAHLNKGQYLIRSEDFISQKFLKE